MFRNRATELGVTDAAAQVAIDNGIGTLGQFGFASSYIPGPGGQDETPLKELVVTLYGLPDVASITLGQMTAIRRLYLEALLLTIICL